MFEFDDGVNRITRQDSNVYRFTYTKVLTPTMVNYVYGGVNLDGTVVTSSDDWNQAYYGKKVLAPDVLVRGDASNKGAAGLLNEVAAAAKK